MWAVPEGTVVFPGEPILTVKASVMQAQLIETAITYSEKNQLFDFGDHVIDPDGVQDSGDEIVLTNETVESITVLADTGAIELTRTERVVDTETYVDFGGWTVPFTVEKGEIDIVSLIVMKQSYKSIIIGYTQALADYYNSWTNVLREINNENFSLKTEKL